jgi:hypothetical protein
MGYCFQAVNPPVTGIILHLGKDFICLTHQRYDTIYDSMMQVRLSLNYYCAINSKKSFYVQVYTTALRMVNEAQRARLEAEIRRQNIRTERRDIAI